MKRRGIFLIVSVVLFVVLVVVLKSGIVAAPSLSLAANGWLPGVVFLAALIDSVNPCAFGVLLLTIAFLMSLSSSRGKILKIGGVYILGLFVVYIAIGLGILGTLDFFGAPHFMVKVGASVLIFVGIINVLNDLFPEFPLKLKIPKAAYGKIAFLMEKGSLPAAFLLGVLVGFYEFPCTGGPYLLVLGLLHDKATYFTGLAYLVFYNLVFVLPLLIVLFLVSNGVILEKVREWKKSDSNRMRLWGGVIMIMFGVLLFLFL